jgi:hypothetical protein
MVFMELTLNANVEIIDGMLVISRPGSFNMVICDRGCTYSLRYGDGTVGEGGATKTFAEAFKHVVKWMERDAG